MPARSSSTSWRPSAPKISARPATARRWPPNCSDRPRPTGRGPLECLYLEPGRSPLASALVRLVLGERRYDLRTRTLVMGIVNRTPDSFYDRGATYQLDALLTRASAMVADGADLI